MVLIIHTNDDDDDDDVSIDYRKAEIKARLERDAANKIQASYRR